MAPATKQSKPHGEARDRDLSDLQQALLSRREQLTGEIEDGHQRRLNEDSFSEIAGEVGDAGDASLATEQSDLRNSQIERDVAELRDVEAALERFDEGMYGICTRCARDIGVARLKANPSAARCIECQTAHERQFAGTATPSL